VEHTAKKVKLSEVSSKLAEIFASNEAEGGVQMKGEYRCYLKREPAESKGIFS